LWRIGLQHTRSGLMGQPVFVLFAFFVWEKMFCDYKRFISVENYLTSFVRSFIEMRLLMWSPIGLASWKNF
jgi:hypothetical protein